MAKWADRAASASLAPASAPNHRAPSWDAASPMPPPGPAPLELHALYVTKAVAMSAAAPTRSPNRMFRFHRSSSISRAATSRHRRGGGFVAFGGGRRLRSARGVVSAAMRFARHTPGPHVHSRRYCDRHRPGTRVAAKRAGTRTPCSLMARSSASDTRLAPSHRLEEQPELVAPGGRVALHVRDHGRNGSPSASPRPRPIGRLRRWRRRLSGTPRTGQSSPSPLSRAAAQDAASPPGASCASPARPPEKRWRTAPAGRPSERACAGRPE